MRILALAVVLLLAAPAAAQTSDLHRDNPTLYLHRGADSGPYFLNDLPEDGAYASSGYNVLGIALSCSTYGFCWAADADPTPSYDLLLDPTGVITVQVSVKTIVSVFGVGTVGDGPGYGDLNVGLTVGGASWGAFAESGHQFSGEWETFVYEIAPTAPVIPAGTPIGLTVDLNGVSVGAVIGMSESAAVTSVTFPVLNEPPTTGGEAPEGNVSLPGVDVLYGELGAGNQSLELMPDNATEQHILNWTQTATNLTVQGLYNGTGNVTLSLMDGNTTVLEHAWQGNGTLDFELMDLQPGNWTVHLGFEAATGALTLDLFETPAEGAEPAPATEEEPQTVDEESPGFQIVALLALLGAIVVLRRK